MNFCVTFKKQYVEVRTLCVIWYKNYNIKCVILLGTFELQKKKEIRMRCDLKFELKIDVSSNEEFQGRMKRMMDTVLF